MSKIQKLREKFCSKPIRNDMTFDEIITLASAYGCRVMSGGKHVRIVHIASGRIVPIPRHGNTVGEAYIKQLRDLFDDIDSMEENN